MQALCEHLSLCLRNAFQKSGDRLKTVLKAIVSENGKNRGFYNGLNWFHKGLKILRSMILSFMIIFLISSGVVFFFYCFDHSVKPWEVVFKMSRKGGNDGKID